MKMRSLLAPNGMILSASQMGECVEECCVVANERSLSQCSMYLFPENNTYSLSNWRQNMMTDHQMQ